MYKSMASVLVVCALAGCTTAPVAQDVTTGSYLRYWRMRPDSMALHDIPQQRGCMRVQIVIDSQGEVSDYKLLAVVGSEFAAWAPELIHRLHYDPAPDNAARTPIRTVIPWTFNYHDDTKAGPAGTSAAAVKAKLAAGPSLDDEAWRVRCAAEMDKQMGITPAPAAAAASDR